MRVTQRQQIEAALHHLRTNQEAVNDLRRQVGTGRRILRPADDPQGTQRSINLRSFLNSVGTSLRNIEFSQHWMEASANALNEMNKVITSARVAGQGAASDTVSAEIRLTIAIQIKEHFSNALSLANSQHQGNHIFAGYQVNQRPFEADLNDLTFTYHGDSHLIQHEIDPGFLSPVNIPGDDPLFSTTLNALKELYDALIADDRDAISNSLSSLDQATDLCSNQESALGARLKVLDNTRTRLQHFEVDLKELLSGTEDVDMPEAILRLESYEQGYQATLLTFARSLQRSLFDYMG